MAEDKSFNITFKGDASSVKQASEEAQTAITQTADKSEQGSDKTVAANERTRASYVGLAVGIASTAAAAYAMYLQWDNIQDSQLAVQRATYRLGLAQKRYNDLLADYEATQTEVNKASEDFVRLESLKAELTEENVRLTAEYADAERDYRDVITEFGGSSEQARQAAIRLAEAKAALVENNEALTSTETELMKAQELMTASTANLTAMQESLSLMSENLAIQEENLQQKTDNISEATTMLALTALPLTVSAVGTLITAWKAFDSTNAAGMISRISTSLRAHQTALLGTAGAIGAVMFAYAAFNADSPKTRAIYSALTAAAMALTVAQIALAAAKALNITLSTFGLGAIVVGTAIASFAAVYGLASAFGGSGDVAGVPEVSVASLTSGGDTSTLSNHESIYIEQITVETNDPDAVGDALVTALQDKGLF